jgi:hypothetical protein
MSAVFRLGFAVLSLVCLLGVGRLQAADKAGRVLLIHDGARVVEPLADFVNDRGGLEVVRVDQDHLPLDWTEFRAVVGYIHGRLREPTELAIIDYTKRGGRFVALHHMISSAKAQNRYYFDFLGVRLDHPQAAREAVEPGKGYGWYTADDRGVEVTLVNLHPAHFIVSNGVHWASQVRYQSSDWLAVEREYPAIVLPKAEAYLNHKFTDGREKTVLCGMKYTDPRTRVVFEQDRAVWFKSYGAGTIVYIQPGHFPEEYREPNLAQMVLNAITWNGR